MRTRLCRVSAAVLVVVVLARVMSPATPEPTVSLRIGSVVKDAAISSDGEYLAVACVDGGVRLFEIGSWELLWEAHLHDTSAVTSVAFLPSDEEEVVVSVSTGADVVFLLTTSGREVRRINLFQELRSANAYDEDAFIYAYVMAVSPDGTMLASGCTTTGHIKLVDLMTGESRIVIRHGMVTAMESGLVFNPDGVLLASSDNRSTIVFDIMSSEEVATPSRPGVRLNDSGSGGDMEFSPDGALFAMTGGTRSTSVVVYRTDTWELLQRLGLRNTGLEGSLAFSSDGRLLAAGGYPFALWDASTLALLESHQVSTYRRGGIAWMGFTPDMELLLVAGGSRGFIEAWRLSDLYGD
jgi:WD40 repeat protein